MGLLSGGHYNVTGGIGGVVILSDIGTQCGTSGGPATADITIYNATHPTRAGQAWVDNNCLIEYSEDIVLPRTSIGNYQVKWDYLSGNAPYAPGSSTEATWIDLSTTNFVVQWRAASGPTSILGTVTVSLRVGTSPSIIKTAVYDGEVTLSGKGK